MGHRTSSHHNIASWICVTDSLLSTPIAILQLDLGASSEDCQLWIPHLLHMVYNALGTTRLEKAMTLTMSALDSDESIASNISTKSTNEQQSTDKLVKKNCKIDLTSVLTETWQNETEYLPMFLLHIYYTAFHIPKSFGISNTQNWSTQKKTENIFERSQVSLFTPIEIPEQFWNIAWKWTL